MPRPREFDYDEAVDRATELFWRRGFHATSIQEIVDATGVNRGSLYSVFGSKHGLFTTALRRYVERDGVGGVIADARDRPLEDMLKDMFALVVDAGGAPDGAGRQGCFLTNTVVELGGAGVEPSQQVGRLILEIEEMLTERLRDARKRGEIAADKDPRALARFLIANIQGMRVLSKLEPGRKSLNEIGEQARAHVFSGARA